MKVCDGHKRTEQLPGAEACIVCGRELFDSASSARFRSPRSGTERHPRSTYPPVQPPEVL